MTSQYRAYIYSCTDCFDSNVVNVSELIKSHKNEILSVGDIDIDEHDSSALDDDQSERGYLL